jgi:hydrogenase expression/formation protein HypC
VGKWVLIHAGFAMARIDEEEARRTLVLMEEIGALQDELASIRNASV